MIMAGLSAIAASESDKIPYFVGADIYYKNMALIDAAIPRVLAALATVVSVVCCHLKERDFTQPDPEASFIENLLRMSGISWNSPSSAPNPQQVRYLQKCMILYAEHGMANATTSFLMTASTHSDPIFCLMSALGGMYGPLHGAALGVVHEMLRRTGSPENVPQLMKNVKARKQVLYGYGHRIYRAIDPRSQILKEMLGELHVDVESSEDGMLATALEIDRVASTDEFFVKRGIRANPDLYESVLLKTIGIPDELMIPIMSVSRNVGFMAHWREFMSACSLVARYTSHSSN